MIDLLVKSAPGFIGCTSGFKDCKTVIFGAPYDGTATYRPGSRFAPAAIRAESDGIETYSPYQDKDIEDIAVHDAGNLALPFGNREGALEAIGTVARGIINAGKRFLMLGGEHLITLPAARELLKACPDLCIIQFDAHADLRDEYIGETLSHATVMRRIWDAVGDGRIWQFGIRSGTREEYQFAKDHTRMETFGVEKIGEAIKEIGRRAVYITIDIDVLDPSLLPGTGTPEAGGIAFNALIKALLELKGLKIAGADIVELSPCYDPTGVSTLTACKLVREVLLLMG